MRSPADIRVQSEAFGHSVLGPILADFCLRLWLFQNFFPRPEGTTILFCARGGLRLKLAYERFLAVTGLPCTITAENLMVSRLVAARTAVPGAGDGLLSELGREFHGRPMAEVVSALTQRADLALSQDWQRPFEREAFARMLAADNTASAGIRREISRQDDLFRKHLAAVTGGRRQVILCDTGLYGSTVRLLQEGISELDWYCVQFARSNYKKLATPHFKITRGLSIESDAYKPWRVQTSALRFWHLIESVLEPDLPSVRSFKESPACRNPVSNLEVEGWQRAVEPQEPGLFSGVMSYIERLDAADVRDIDATAQVGWKQLKRAVVWPSAATVAVLGLPDRSRDFGRLEKVSQFSTSHHVRPAERIRESLWREGEIVRSFPRMGRAGLVALETVYSARALWAEGKRRLPRKTRPTVAEHVAKPTTVGPG